MEYRGMKACQVSYLSVLVQTLATRGHQQLLLLSNAGPFLVIGHIGGRLGRHILDGALLQAIKKVKINK